jgi:hypothetical protein
MVSHSFCSRIQEHILKQLYTPFPFTMREHESLKFVTIRSHQQKQAEYEVYESL